MLQSKSNAVDIAYILCSCYRYRRGRDRSGQNVKSGRMDERARSTTRARTLRLGYNGW